MRLFNSLGRAWYRASARYHSWRFDTLQREIEDTMGMYHPNYRKRLRLAILEAYGLDEAIVGTSDTTQLDKPQEGKI